jgi:hypothetical protein
VEDEELLAENFATARSIAMLINPKMEHISPSGVPNAPSSGQSELESGEAAFLNHGK